PVVLFFFCGCDPCHTVARQWARVEAREAATIIVFTGDAPGAQLFGQETGLKGEKAAYLLDPEEKGAHRFGVESCPRVFLLDAGGIVRYKSDAPTGPLAESGAARLLSTTLVALRQAAKGPVAPTGLAAQ